MKRSLPSKIPKFKNDEEIAAFMEKYSAFDLVDAGLAEIVLTPLFVRRREKGKAFSKAGRTKKVKSVFRKKTL